MSMPPTEEEKTEGGVARSLDDLFAQAEQARDPPSSSPTGDAGGPGQTPGPSGVAEHSPTREAPSLPEGVQSAEATSTGKAASSPEPAPAPETMMPPEPPPPNPREDRVRTATESLEQAVDSFLTGSGDVVDATRRIRDDALVLREANEQDPMLDVVERLALAGEDDPAALALARQLATPGVCAGLAMRLAGARDEERRATLVQVCHRLGEEAAGAVARALAEADGRSERKNLVAALAGLGEQGLRQAEVMVQDGTWQVVRNGVSILSELGGDRVVEHLVGTLAHHHPKVRRETIQALARIGGETSTLLVINKLDDPDADVRATAARAIGTLGSERSVRNLLERLDQESVGEVQQEILRALGQIGDPGAVPAIEKRAVGGFLKRPPAEVRVAAYRALALIGTPHAKKVLNDATDDKDMDVRAAARSLLGLS